MLILDTRKSLSSAVRSRVDTMVVLVTMETPSPSSWNRVVTPGWGFVISQPSSEPPGARSVSSRSLNTDSAKPDIVLVVLLKGMLLIGRVRVLAGTCIVDNVLPIVCMHVVAAGWWGVAI